MANIDLDGANLVGKYETNTATNSTLDVEDSAEHSKREKTSDRQCGIDFIYDVMEYGNMALLPVLRIAGKSMESL
jgi:hypothetical protein